MTVERYEGRLAVLHNGLYLSNIPALIRGLPAGAKCGLIQIGGIAVAVTGGSLSAIQAGDRHLGWLYPIIYLVMLIWLVFVCRYSRKVESRDVEQFYGMS